MMYFQVSRSPCHPMLFMCLYQSNGSICDTPNICKIPFNRPLSLNKSTGWTVLNGFISPLEKIVVTIELDSAIGKRTVWHSTSRNQITAASIWRQMTSNRWRDVIFLVFGPSIFKIPSIKPTLHCKKVVPIAKVNFVMRLWKKYLCMKKTTWSHILWNRFAVPVFLKFLVLNPLYIVKK